LTARSHGMGVEETSGCPDRSPSRPSQQPPPADSHGIQRGAPRAGSRRNRGGRPARPPPRSPPATTVCAQPDPRPQGTPRILVPPPWGFGTSTARHRRAGSRLPEESRFQNLVQACSSDRTSNSATVTGGPRRVRPLFALTFSHASQTARFEISERLARCFQLVHATSSSRQPLELIERTQSRTTRPLRSALITRASRRYYEAGSASAPPRRYSAPCGSAARGDSLPDGPRTRDRPVFRDAPSSCSVRKPADPGSRRLHAGHHLASKADIRQAHPRSRPKHPGFDVVLGFSARQQRFARASAFPVPA